MPQYGPSNPGGGGGEINTVTVDSAGFVHVQGGPLPFKDEDEAITRDGVNYIRVHHKILHPTFGEISNASADFQI